MYGQKPEQTQLTPPSSSLNPVTLQTHSTIIIGLNTRYEWTKVVPYNIEKKKKI